MPDLEIDDTPTEPSVANPLGDDAEALAGNDEQADASTSAERDTEQAGTDADDAQDEAQDALIDEAEAPADKQDWVRQTNKVVQKRLREAAQAKKEAAELKEQIARLRVLEDGVRNLLSSKDPSMMIRAWQEQFGIKPSAGVQEDQGPSFTFKPSKPLSKDPEAAQELQEIFDTMGRQLLAQVQSVVSERTRPLVEGVSRSEAMARDQEWSRLKAAAGPGIDQWRAKAEALQRERGLTLDQAVLLASNGASHALMQRRKQEAAQKARGAATPVAPSRGRSPAGATAVVGTPGKRRSLADYWNVGSRKGG